MVMIMIMQFKNNDNDNAVKTDMIMQLKEVVKYSL